MPSLTINRTNAKDAILLDLFIFNPTTGQSIGAVGLFDTGSDHTAICGEIANHLGLERLDRILHVAGVTGTSVAYTSIVTIGLLFDSAHKVEITNHEVAVLEGAANQVLIGRDFLERFDFTMLRDGRFTMSCV